MQTITAFYDSVAEAQQAEVKLRSAGFGAEQVRVINRAADAGAIGDTAPTRDTEDRGFFASLRDIFVPDEDAYTYDEGIRRGGALLTARVDEARADQAIELLEDSGAVDVDSRAQSWRGEGWEGYQAGAVAGSGSYDSAAGGLDRTTARSSDVAGTGDLGLRDSVGEETIPIVEEELRVGKRDTSRGSVRVRSYIVETPVEENVTLQDERVSIERRPVDRALGTLPEDAFRERTIEATERSEEAVVDKTARVKEELVLRKELDERTQTIADSIRRTEVEVEDDRTKRGLGTETDVTRTERSRDKV